MSQPPLYAQKLVARTWLNKNAVCKYGCLMSREEMIKGILSVTKMSAKDAAKQVDLWMGES